jgi:hypothetical protein
VRLASEYIVPHHKPSSGITHLQGTGGSTQATLTCSGCQGSGSVETGDEVILSIYFTRSGTSAENNSGLVADVSNP